jgi:hypothetical protein
MDQETLFVINWMRGYCNEIFELNQQFSPPAINAAHGHFVNLMVAIDKKYKNYPIRMVEGGDPQKMLLTFRRFPEDCERGFAIGLHEPSTFSGQFKIIRDRVAEAALFAVALVEHAGKFGDDESTVEQKKEAKRMFNEDLKGLVRLIKEDFTTKGNHGNGFIANYIRVELDGSRIFQSQMMQNLTNPKIISLNNLWTEFLKTIDNIDATDQDPWLTGKWQTEFVAAHRALWLALGLMLNTK